MDGHDLRENRPPYESIEMLYTHLHYNDLIAVCCYSYFTCLFLRNRSCTKPVGGGQNAQINVNLVGRGAAGELEERTKRSVVAMKLERHILPRVKVGGVVFDFAAVDVEKSTSHPLFVRFHLHSHRLDLRIFQHSPFLLLAQFIFLSLLQDSLR